MNKILFNTLFVIALVLGMINFTSCEDDDENERVESKFSFDSVNYDNNNPHFWSLSKAKDENLILIYSWYFGNGEYSSDSSFTPSYNFPGDYLVQLNITTSEGVSDVDTMTYHVSKINPELKANKYLANLCINSDSSDTKNWVLSSAKGHMSLGSSPSINNGDVADYISDPITEERTYPTNYFIDSLGIDSAYNNIMSFTLEHFVYKTMDTDTINNHWLTNWYFANSEFGYDQAEGDDIRVDVTTGIDTAGYYNIEENDDGSVFIELSNKNFLLYYEGKPSKTKYQVLALYDDLLVVRKPYFDADGLPAGYRYLRYVPEGDGNKEIPVRDMSILNPPTDK